MTHEEKITPWIGPGKTGAEIISDATPLPGFAPPPIYVDCGVVSRPINAVCPGGLRSGAAAAQTENGPAGPCTERERPVFKSAEIERGRVDALPFHDNCLDYVACSHVLPRLANPVAALAEWYRVLRPGGILYLIVGDRRATADHTRDATGIDHLLEDYLTRRNACDAIHIDEFVYDMDWSRFAPELSPDDIPGERAALARRLHEAVADGHEIAIPFHTFDPGNLRELVETLCAWPRQRFNWEIVNEVEGFQDAGSILLVIRVQKGWLDRARAGAFDVTAGDDRRKAVVRRQS